MRFGLFATGLLGALASGVAVSQTNREEVYYDVVTGGFYRENPDSSLQKIGGFPHVRNGKSIGLHVLNVNTYGKRILIGTKQVALFQEAPAGLNLVSLVKVAVPSSGKMLQEVGAGKGTDTQAQLDALKAKIDLFNRQCAAFKEVSNLDSSLKNMAAYGEEPRPVPGSKDPRQPGIVASEHMTAKFRQYVAKLFSDCATQEVKSKGTETQSGAPVLQDDLGSLADDRVSEIKSTFSQIEESYTSVKQILAPALNVPIGSRSKSAEGGIDSTPAPPSPALTSFARQLDQAYSQAQQNVAFIDSDAANRQAHLDSAASLYRELTTKNFYQFDGPTTLTRSDEVVFTIQIFDAKAALPSQTALAILDQDEATSLPMAHMVGKGTTSPASSGSKPIRTAKPNGAPPTIPGFGASKQQPSEAKAKADQTGQPDAEQTIEVPVYLTGRLKLDFSSGVFVSNLTNRNYNTVPGATAGSFKIHRGSHDDFSSGVAGLLHVYVTSAAEVVPALSLGVGQAFSGGQQYFLGGSLIAGRDQRFILTLGLAGAQVQRVDGFSVGDTISSTIVPTRDVFRVGYFLGLTYNLK